jgi:hypothetical protein
MEVGMMCDLNLSSLLFDEPCWSDKLDEPCYVFYLMVFWIVNLIGHVAWIVNHVGM